MSVRRMLTAVPVVCLVALTACGSDDDSGSDGLDCDTGQELSQSFADMTASADAPTVDSLEDIRDRLDDWDAPDEVSDEVQTVKDSVGVFIEQLGSAEPDFEAVSAAGESMSAAGQTIDAFLADNC